MQVADRARDDRSPSRRVVQRQGQQRQPGRCRLRPEGVPERRLVAVVPAARVDRAVADQAEPFDDAGMRAQSRTAQGQHGQAPSARARSACRRPRASRRASCRGRRYGRGRRPETSLPFLREQPSTARRHAASCPRQPARAEASGVVQPGAGCVGERPSDPSGCWIAGKPVGRRRETRLLAVGHSLRDQARARIRAANWSRAIRGRPGPSARRAAAPLAVAPGRRGPAEPRQLLPRVPHPVARPLHPSPLPIDRSHPSRRIANQATSPNGFPRTRSIGQVSPAS